VPEERDLKPDRPLVTEAQEGVELVVGPEVESAAGGDNSGAQSGYSSASGQGFSRQSDAAPPPLGHSSSTESHLKMPEAGQNLAAGTMFDDKYEILEVLGEGGMSVVYKARHALMNNIVAIKLLKGRYASDSTTILRFQREGQAVSRLDHPNIVRVYDFGVSREGQPFLAIEYLRGQALSEVIAEQGPLPVKKAAAIYGQVTGALASAHACGVIHRDLKPSNIIVLDPQSAAPTVKIVDFGIAKVFDEEEAGQNKLTQTGDIFGSPLYMSPEQCLGKKMDDRSDIYSMGCLMYEGLTGAPPLEGENMFQTFKKQVGETPRTFREVAPHNKDLALIEPVVFKCLAKDPGDRYQTMAQLARALDAIKEGGTAGSALAGNIKTIALVNRERFKSISWRRALYLVLILVVLAGLLASFFVKSLQVDFKPSSPVEQACFEVDRGQYQSAAKQFDSMLSQAKRDNLNESVVRFLGNDAVLKHILADKRGEARDDQEAATIAAAGGNRSALEDSTMQLIDALLAGGKSSSNLENSLTKPANELVALAQNLAWSQEYEPAERIMAGLIDKLSTRLGTSSALLVDLKVQYASMLLQKIVNPVSASSFTPGVRQHVISEATALLQTSLNLAAGDDLLLARSNLALANALSGNNQEASELRDSVVAAYKATRGQKNRALIEARLADTVVALNKPGEALVMYKRAYQRFFAARQYPQAAYCISAFSRCCWLSGQLKERYEFLTQRLQSADLAAPEAAQVRSEAQAWLAELESWMAGIAPSDLRVYFDGDTLHGKSQGQLLLEAESLALESFVATQNSRPSKLWLEGSAVDTLTRMYYNSNALGRAVPLLRLKLAVAERSNNIKTADEARNNLALVLLTYPKNYLAQTFSLFENCQISPSGTDPRQEAHSLYEQSFKRVTAGGADSIFWLDEWFPNVAAEFAKTQADKDRLLTACRISCQNVARVYGRDSLEYMIQLRWHGRLAWHLGQGAVARKSLSEARDVANARPSLPLLERRNVYFDLAYVCQGMGDKTAAAKYMDQMNLLPRR
jgi:serine/threonine protein kinase